MAVRAIVAGDGVDVRLLWRVFRASLLPGLAATAAAAALGWLLLFDLGAVAAGRVPGGSPVLVGTGVAAAALFAVGMLCVVHLGRDTASGAWSRAVRWAARSVWRQPVTAAMVAGVSTIAVVIGVFIPITAPLLVGYGMFAAHVVAGRFLREPVTAR